MARKPIHVEMAGMRTPRERMWQAIRRLRKFTCMQVQEVMGSPYPTIDSIQEYLYALKGNGYLKALNRSSRFEEIAFELVKDAIDAPRFNKAGRPATQGLATLAMWRAMKALKEFDYLDVQKAASLGETCKVTGQTAKSYVNALGRAGYFRTVCEAKPGVPARFRLVRDTGAHAPAITRRKAVFDRNVGEFTWQQSEQEVCDGLD